MAESAAARGPRSTIADPGGYSEAPLVQFIRNDVGGILSKSAALSKWGPDKFDQNRSLWDGAPQFKSPRHNLVYNSKTGVAPDVAAQAAADAGLLPQGADADTLWSALQKESDSAHSRMMQVAAQRQTELRAGKQFKAFTAAVEKPIPGEKPITGAQLNVGDAVQIGTEKMKVTDIDPDTYDVTLEDGSKYGIQHVTNDQAFYGRIEAGNPDLIADAETRSVPAGTPEQAQAFELSKPESVEEQRARLQQEAAAASDAENLANRKAQAQFGWQQKLTGTAGDLGQGDLLGEPQPEIFGSAPRPAEGVAPPAAAAVAAADPNVRAGSQIKQLTEAAANALKTAKPQPMLTRWQRISKAISGSIVTARQSLTNGVNNARAAWILLKNGYLRPPVIGDFLGAVKDWQGADQRSAFEVRQFVRSITKQIRDPLTREAITNYIQADGDANLLRQRASASNAKWRPGYEAATRLTPDQQTLAANIRQYFDGMLQDGINAGILDHGLENYITQIWKRPNKFTNALMADLQSGKLQTNFKYARGRVFSSFFDGEQAGYMPATKDVSALVATYDQSFHRAMSARGFVTALRNAEAANGDPVVRFSGMTQPVPKGAEPAEAYLIRSRALPENAVTADGRQYRIVDHPSLRGWKFVVQGDTDAPAYYQADMLVHPDYAPQLRNMLSGSAFRSGTLGAVVSPFLKAGAIAKQTKLSLSIFHLDQEGLHALFHRVNPANLERIDFDNPNQWALARGGLQVADYNAMELFSEGLTGGGLVSKIPVLGKLQNGFNEFLFKDYIPRLKMTMALHALERNAARYPNLSLDSLAELTARQGNAAFGELNYKLMARNQTLQDFFRLTVLAPDFLEARSRFVGQALKPYGAEQRNALLLGGAVMYVTARALNKWLDDDPHWTKPFSVVYNGREYRLRSVMGDVSEAFTDPRRFFYNRFSPWLKTATTFGTGRDYRGVKLTNWEQVKDALGWLVPIPLGAQPDANLAQRLLGSAGVSNRPAETPVDVAYKSAEKFKESLTDPHIQMEVKRAQQETYAPPDYVRVNRALIEGNNERATQELVNLLRQGKPPASIVKYYSNLPAQPFTGSRLIEAKWMAQMSPAERKQYAAAVQQRVQMAQRFGSLFRNAYQQTLRDQNR